MGKRYAKCSYIFDGATNNKYNNGCGRGAPANPLPPAPPLEAVYATKCGTNPNLQYPDTCFDPSQYNCDASVSKQTAFFNMCGYNGANISDVNSGHTCTVADVEVTEDICEGVGGTVPVPSTHGGMRQCIFPGAAMNFHGQDDWQPVANNEANLRTMVKQRILNNGGTSNEGGTNTNVPNIELWNEVVVDARTIVEDMYTDPAGVVEAFIFGNAKNEGARTNALNYARAMQKEYCDKNEAAAQNCPPILEVDDNADVNVGPFKVPA